MFMGFISVKLHIQYIKQIDGSQLQLQFLRHQNALERVKCTVQLNNFSNKILSISETVDHN